jgi:hypothetical protein
MSAQEELLLTQRILNILFQRGHMMTRFTINYLLRELNEHVERMINLNDTTERSHVDEQTLLLQQLNEYNERISIQEHTEQPTRYTYQDINPQIQYINPNINERDEVQNDNEYVQNDNEYVQNDIMDEESYSLSEQTDPIYNEPTFTVDSSIYYRLFMRRETPIRNNPIERSKVIARKKLEEPCPEDCSICQETPKHKDAVCTECNHYYCKECWESWMNADGSNKKCPTCRKDMPKITTFKGRAPNRRRVV